MQKETDNQGNEMKLYKYDEKGEKVILLDVQRGRGTYTAAMKVSYDE